MDFLTNFFHQNTKKFKLPKGKWPQRVYFKNYPQLSQIKLPQNLIEPVLFLKDALLIRKSERNYCPEPIDIRELSSLLFYGAGLTKSNDEAGNKWRRPYPSGGGLYPLEIYLGATRISGLPVGVYHFNVKDFTLEELGKEDLLGKFKDAATYDFARNASLIVAISAVFERNMIKYRRRGYRCILLEAGHLAQNFNLLAPALGLKCCDLLGFQDDELSATLGLNEKTEQVIFALTFGK